MNKEKNLLNIGVVGAGQISQAAHFEACQKAKNARLFAICDVARDLLASAAAAYSPERTYTEYDELLADPDVQAVLIGVADQFHVSMSVKALSAGKHVLVEKPMGLSVEECLELRTAVEASGLVLQVGHNRRFDPGVSFAREFVRDGLGKMQSYRGWYFDSTFRYQMTDNLQPLVRQSHEARKPGGNPKADRMRYFLLTHGSHLLDTALFLGGEISSVRARHNDFYDSHCWYVELAFAGGALGHVELIVPYRGDFEEGFQIGGEFGSIRGRLPLTWFHKSGDVECFSARDGLYRRPLGADAFSYRLQVESFAGVILDGRHQTGTNVYEALATTRALAAISRSAGSGEAVALAGITGEV